MSIRTHAFATSICITFSAIAPATEVSMDSLLNELTDPTTSARLPEIPYQSAQASSYDRRSVSADKPGWFANCDWSFFVREETTEGRLEYVMMDESSPGALVHFWAVWKSPMDGRGDNSTNGTIRIYLDGNQQPVVATNLTDLFVEKKIFKPPFCETAQPDAPPNNRCHNIYLPVTYAKSCKVTYQPGAKMHPDPNAREKLYYNLDYRRYPAGTAVKTWKPTDLMKSAGLIAATGKAMTEPSAPGKDAKSEVLKTPALAAGATGVKQLPGPAAIREIRFRFDESLSPDALTAALRAVKLRLKFDEKTTASVPVGDFFATGTFIRPFKTRILEAQPDGTLICRWTMPFAKSASVAIVNEGRTPVGFAAEITTSPWKWDARSMHFHAFQNAQIGLTIEPLESGARDVNLIELTGKGRLAGDTLAIVNRCPGDKPTRWWGEGDEKIHVDGDAFPRHFGTGTEDYYGYSWSRPESFSSPWHAQPYGNGNLEPKDTLFSQSTVNTRLRFLDDIPFEKSLRFDMEIWHWFPATMDFVPTVFYYLHP